jgi:transcriptional regulator with XRE-family HTH domain
MKLTLKGARINAGYTQKQVADKVNVHEVTVTNWELGHNKIPAVKLKELSYLYKLKMDDFLLP